MSQGQLPPAPPLSCPEALHSRPQARQVWRLDDGQQTLVFACQDAKIPALVYWGAALPQAEDLGQLVAAGERDFTGGALDALPPLSLSPQSGDGFPGTPGLRLQDARGQPLTPRFIFHKAEQSADSLRLVCQDAAQGLRLSFHFRLFKATAIVCAETRLSANQPIRLYWLAAPVLPAPAQADRLIEFSGRWCGEFQQQESAWGQGARYRHNPTGRSGHEHFPGLILPLRGASYQAGEAYGFHYAASGGHDFLAETLPDGRRQLQWGQAQGSERQAGKRFSSAKLYARYSSSGLNALAQAFQRQVRQYQVTWPSGIHPRRVHFNSWEAVYFRHDLAELYAIASRAAALGAERFVLDDGWFKNRSDDRRALGDWSVDPLKYPQGLTPLIERVQALGMDFGLWVEPEMVSPDSDLYRAHPDWILGSAEQTLGRGQYALDMRRAEVQAYLFEQLAALISDYAIAYLKWDHNRILPYSDAGQVRGTHRLLARLRRAFPEVEIESCASGGGRLDYGMLRHTQRVWLSDSNDARNRAVMQQAAALFLPAAVTGSHVGPRRCHTSGRVVDMAFRAWVAAQRHLGLELDPRELDAAEAAGLARVIGWWKANRDWLMTADILLLDSPDPALLGALHRAETGERFVLFANKIAESATSAPLPLRLTGLEPHSFYRVELVNKEELEPLSRADLALKTGSLRLSGTQLMQQGLCLPWTFPERVWVLEGKRERGREG